MNELFCGQPQPLTSERIAARDSMNARLRLESVPCLCGSATFDPLASVDRYGIQQPTVICRACGLIQSNPRMREADLIAFYASDEYRTLYDGGTFDYAPRYTEATGRTIFRALAPHKPRSVIEIGAGGGWNLVGFRNAGVRIVGYDYSEKLVAFGHTQGIQMRRGSIDEAIASGEKFDAVVLNHVLEHFLDPVAELRKLTGLLSERGVVFIGVPATNFPWVQLLQNAHLYYFTRSTLAYYLAVAGFSGRIEFENPWRMHAVARPSTIRPAPCEPHTAAIARLRRNRFAMPFMGVIERLMAVYARFR